MKTPSMVTQEELDGLRELWLRTNVRVIDEPPSLRIAPAWRHVCKHCGETIKGSAWGQL